MARRLKVFRTPIGFHDAFVAAPSRKAALAAWGSDRDLFARGVADEVAADDPLAAEPLARPGEVVRRSRGTAEEQIAALPADKPKKPARKAAAKPKLRRPAPPPDRGPLDRIEAELARLTANQEKDADRLAEQIDDLLDRQRRLLKDQADELAALRERRDKAEAAYRAALRRHDD